MRFLLAKSAASTNPKNKVRVVVEWMHGDADAFTKDKLADFPVEGEIKKDITQNIKPNADGTLEDLLTLLETIKANYELYDDDDKQTNLLSYPGYREFFHVTDCYSDHWPGDSTTDGDRPASFEGFEVFYFDALGNEFKVNVQK